MTPGMAPMTSRALIRWSLLHERRVRTVPAIAAPLVGGAALAAWVWWRSGDGVVAASHGWLAGALLAYAVAFMRVPFHIYWRGDAALLAQLPIEGRPLFDAALVRCLRAAGATTLAAVLGALPLAVITGDAAIALRCAAVAGALGAAAGLLLPGVTVGAAALVVQGGGDRALRAATALGGAPARERAQDAAHAAPPASPSAILGALPGFAATVVLAASLLTAPWLAGRAPDVAPGLVLGAIAIVSAVAGAAARAGSAIMGRVLRDVSALDRQRLATLDVKPPSPIERLIARLVGDAALPYRKNALLVRRRYPMAFALGAIAFGVLVIVGLVRPDDPTPWLAVVIGGAACYGIVLGNRLRHPPIELARLSATLPLAPRALARARWAWLAGWWTVFAAAPAVFAALRQAEPVSGIALIAAATAAIIVASALQR